MENNSSILRKVIVTLFVVLCFILQCSVFNSLALGGIIPNLMIILTSSFGFMRGEKEGLRGLGDVYKRQIKLPLALIVVSDISYGLLCYILMFLLRGRFHFPYYFTRVILPEALYTIVVTIVLYPLILKVNQKLEEKEKRSAQKFVS